MGTRTTAQKALLTSTGTELVDFKFYDKDGNYIDTYEQDVLLKAPVILRPINKSLNVEYLRPVKKVVRETKLKKLNIVNQDPISNYGGFRMDFTHNSQTKAEVEVNSKALSGDNLIKTLTKGVNTGDTDINNYYPDVIIQNSLTFSSVRVGNKYQVGFSYYIENSVTNLVDLDYYFIVLVSLYDSANNDSWYYDHDENKFNNFQQTALTNTGANQKYFKYVKNTNRNVWNNFKMELESVENITSEKVKINFSIRELTYTTTNGNTGHTNCFIDNYFIDQIWDESNLFIAERVSNSTDTLTGVHKTEDLLLSNDLGDSLFDGGFDGTFERLIDTGTEGRLDEFITQEILNDYRAFVKRYEGEFYNNNTDPIPVALHNKIWLNFANNTLTEDVSAYIDAMTYDLKANTYNITMHLPNQDDDLASTYSIKYE
jgi:hypothetical protein